MKLEKEEEVLVVERSGLSINHSVCRCDFTWIVCIERIHFAKSFALSHILPAQYECERVFGHSTELEINSVNSKKRNQSIYWLENSGFELKIWNFDTKLNYSIEKKSNKPKGIGSQTEEGIQPDSYFGRLAFDNFELFLFHDIILCLIFLSTKLG